ncbi:hypothetical protein PRZ48_007162 [Zasmidium cellare]|uniref:non-specific serine/threonine protein kinase n=1 Tax=Zasmidium cellare TaxID=395010 RepID=A0ABR0EIN1_ZASCE|nr:hypothetical protein PRZ48_007162 [Zasmidium cellare]
MSSPRGSSSSSPASYDSILPISRSTSFPSVDSNSIDSSLNIEQRIEEEEPLLEPHLADDQEEQGTMFGRSTNNPSRAVSRGPAPVALPRRSSFTKMVHDVQDYFVKGPVIGKTRDVELVEQTKELTFDFKGNDQYDDVETLTEGGEGQCFVKKSKSTGSLFVVKHTNPVKLRNVAEREYPDTKTHKYPNEARILGRTLKAQRNVVQIFQILEDNVNPGRYYLWMEFCSGGDLISQVFFWWNKKRSPVPEQFLLHTIVSLFDGLAFVHHGLRSRGDGRFTEDEFHNPVIHADIKGENIFLRWTNDPLGGMPELVLGDFGIAKPAHRTDVKLNAGTLAYMAPEDVAIHQGCPMTPEHEETWLKVVNSRTTAMDIYALGQVVYQMAAKEPEPREIGLDPSDLRISREYDTPGLCEAIAKCLVVDPSKRAQASFDETLGLLPEINRFRTARNALVQRRMKLDRMEWARPAPRT